jgi:glutamyl-tRNA reductase
VARAVRRHLEPVQQGSLAVLAAQAAVPPVAILGSGAMARAAAEHLGDEATVFARRPTHVAGRATHDWRAAAEALSRYASVISAVPGSTPLFAPADLATALARRRGPLLVLDLGLPPGFEPSLLGDKVRYLGIDDLASAVTPAPSPAAWKHLEQAAPAAWSRLAAPDRVGKVIAEILERADNAVLEEVERFYDRLVQTRDPDRILRQLAHTVARRVLHRPISYIGSTAAEADTVDLLAEAFGVGE